MKLHRSDSEARTLALELLEQVSATVQRGTRNKWLDRARLHDNGFLKLILVDEDEWENPQFAGYKLVLHVWDNLTQTTNYENVHNHRWPFWSMLVCGQLNWQHYCVSNSSEAEVSHIEYEYQSPGRSEHYTLTHKGPVTLELRMAAIVTAGTSLAMTDIELHRTTRIADTVAATVFLQGRQSRPSTNVYMPIGSDSAILENRRSATQSVEVRRVPIELLPLLLDRAVISGRDAISGV